jgi:hypothetical protein
MRGSSGSKSRRLGIDSPVPVRSATPIHDFDSYCFTDRSIPIPTPISKLLKIGVERKFGLSAVRLLTAKVRFDRIEGL